MKAPVQEFLPVRVSLQDLLGRGYCNAVIDACSRLTGEPREMLRRGISQQIECLPLTFQRVLTDMLPRTGAVVGRRLRRTMAGASTKAYNAATNLDLAPLAGYGYFRIGENGRQYFTLKSEHYHAPLGHYFPGYRLINMARMFGVPNATHNNTRGYITRLLEEELVRTANGIGASQWRREGRARLTDVNQKLNRVLNLETGSLAVEAAIKLCLARFYASVPDADDAPLAGRVPVLVVVGDDQGGLAGNYHGTTMVAQLLRGLWPELREQMEKNRILLVRAVRPERIADLQNIFTQYNSAPYKVAGFFHEIVMMNYGGRLLSREFLQQAYTLCAQHDVPAVVDEIQSCMWHHEFFMFREYKLTPAMVAVGKGFPGGEYPASRLIFDAKYDVLPQFGALVTNGQEELAALAYLVTMRWAAANAKNTRAVGEYYFAALDKMAARWPDKIERIEGCRHLAGIGFKGLGLAQAFVKSLNQGGVDISVQNYKDKCPPVALTKLPLIANCQVVDWLLDRFEIALKQI